MSTRAVVVRPLFNDFVSGGLGSQATELRIPVVERWNANAAWASESSVEYAIWAQGQLGGIGDPPIQGNSESTDGSGELVVDTTGVFAVGSTVLVMLRKENAGPSLETVFAVGEETITAT